MERYAIVAEPDARLLQVLGRLVKEAGLEPALARDGAEARSILANRGAPALIVTNLSLPRVDGFALLSELRTTTPSSQCVAVAVSGSMALRTEAYNRRQELGLAALIATGMTVDSMRGVIIRALAAGASGWTPMTAVAKAPSSPPPSPRHLDPQRLARIAAMGVVDDQPADASLQQLVDETAKNFDVPVALISIVLEDRQWFKAHVGLGGRLLRDRGSPIGEAFCRHVVDADQAEPLVVPDATSHPVFAKNPLVVDGTIGSYAGAPLMTARGDVLGTLCIIDQKPLGIGPEQVDQLAALARRVAGELELRSKAARTASEIEQLRQMLAVEQSRNKAIYQVVECLEAVLSQLETGVMLLDEGRRPMYANAALATMVGLTQGQILRMSREDFVQHVATLSDAPEAVLSALHVAPMGPYAGKAEIAIDRPRRRVLRWSARPVDLGGTIAQLAVYTDITAEVELAEARGAESLTSDLLEPFTIE